MHNEFLTTTRYDGDGCGIALAVCNISNDVEYKKISIWIDGVGERQEVFIDDTNTFQTIPAVFSHLDPSLAYSCHAILETGSDTWALKCVASVQNIQANVHSTTSDNVQAGGIVYDLCAIAPTIIVGG